MDEGGGGGALSDRSRLFQFISWLLFVVTLFAVIARLATKYAITRKLEWDDWVILQALTASLAQSIAISIAASNGLGQATSSLTADSLDTTLKAVYVSALFLILACALTKLSLFISLNHLTPKDGHRHVNMAVGGVVILWFIPAILVSIFQCALPAPWDFTHGNRCVDRGAWWSFVVVVNILTDFSIVALYIAIMSQLHVSLSKKLLLLAVFSTRLLVIPTAAIQLVTFLNQLSDPDFATSLWVPTVLNQAVITFSISTACLPYLRPFMGALDSDILRVRDHSDSQEQLSELRSGTVDTSYTGNSSRPSHC
ncbi:hypothetical protein F5Y08DRAFT_137739 [Xylaria arbuscula]|nr:hypothetical protein F5Y08DRAFT_137739 [Xylaria arbuscula]